MTSCEVPQEQSDWLCPGCRSWLQKAVRRGGGPLVRRLVEHMAQADPSGLRRRSRVIVFEECWPLAARPEGCLEDVARAVKNKDAAGLGSLALRLASGDERVLRGGDADRQIRLVAAGLARPDNFWQWAGGLCASEPVAALLEQAQRLTTSGVWDGDRACATAAAYLAVTAGLPPVEPSVEPPLPCPPWVAFDKHTEPGRAAIGRVARQLGVSYQALALASFYECGARVQACEPSTWWTRQEQSDLALAGLDPVGARRLWERACPALEHEVAAVAELLDQRLADGANRARQMTLFPAP